MTYQSTKLYPHSLGLSCAFRQWKAKHSHCQYVHGYSLSFEFTFECETLDDKNWVADFGDLSGIKQMLQENFDHKTIVAFDDPHLEWFKEGERLGTCQLLILPATGCEKFAEEAFNMAKNVIEHKYGNRVHVLSCRVCEHESNSATYTPSFPQKFTAAWNKTKDNVQKLGGSFAIPPIPPDAPFV